MKKVHNLTNHLRYHRSCNCVHGQFTERIISRQCKDVTCMKKLSKYRQTGYKYYFVLQEAKDHWNSYMNNNWKAGE